MNDTKVCHFDGLPADCERYCGICSRMPPDDEKKNGKNEPKEVTDYDWGVPMCPSCNNPTYSDERCVFCGQKLIIRVQEEPDPPEIEGGAIDAAGDLYCMKCGGRKLTTVSHGDGPLVYSYTYRCEKCENRINVKFKRRGGAAW